MEISVQNDLVQNQQYKNFNENWLFSIKLWPDSNTLFTIYIIKCPNYDENSKLFLLVVSDNVKFDKR